ncbi:VOC family protein [Radiobacillus kanasensis]|uniref:VOC family protein n=1 Tax=Radiobacillus kanasensis TaxID=2844358 RepID=UPI001E519DD9|nr:VOC family protein [Radiobacillus kanasensis]UFT98340.1 VOC family protein [Radiobacillus kanasensis]
MMNQICVITIRVTNVQEAVSFYTEKLNFQVSERYGESIVQLEHDGVPLILEESSDIKSGNNVVLGLLSNDIQEDFQAMKERGIRVLLDSPQPCPPGHFFVIEDPFGNQIEIVEFDEQ